MVMHSYAFHHGNLDSRYMNLYQWIDDHPKITQVLTESSCKASKP